MQKIQGVVQQGNTKVLTSGLNSTTLVMGSFPGATVTVFAEPPVAVAISSISRTSNVVTANIGSSAGFIAGQSVTIAGVTDSSYNGVFTITSYIGSNLVYSQTGANSSSSGGTAASVQLASIFSDNVGTALSNPFTSDSKGNWGFYAQNGRYDIEFSGGGLSVPLTLYDFLLNDPVSLGIYDALAYGVTGLGSADDSPKLNTLANTTIPTTGGILFFPPGTYKISTNITFPSYVQLWFAPGAKLSIQTGITATINGPLNAPLSQVFSYTGTGIVVFGSLAVTDIYPQWWGAKFDDTTDDSAAIQNALNVTANSSRILTVRLSGKAYITTGLQVPDGAALVGPNREVGSSIPSAQLRTDHAITMISPVTGKGGSRCKFKDFLLLGDSTNALQGLVVGLTSLTGTVGVVIDGVGFTGFVGTAALTLNNMMMTDVMHCDVDGTGTTNAILVNDSVSAVAAGQLVHIHDSYIHDGVVCVKVVVTSHVIIENNYITSNTSTTQKLIHNVNADRMSVQNNQLEPIQTNTKYIVLENTHGGTSFNAVDVQIGPNNFFLGAGNADGVTVGVTGGGEFPIWNTIIRDNTFMSPGVGNFHIKLVNAQSARLEGNIYGSTYGAMINADATVDNSGGTNTVQVTWNQSIPLTTSPWYVINGTNSLALIGTSSNPLGAGQGGVVYSNGTQIASMLCDASKCYVGSVSGHDFQILSHDTAIAAFTTGGFATLGNGSITAGGSGSIQTTTGGIISQGGSNAIYRCATSGTLPAGTLTIQPGQCGSAVDTGFRSP
jgi:hypothetical protein